MTPATQPSQAPSNGRALRTLRTLWHLRPGQIAWRLRYAAQRKLGRSPTPPTGEAPAARGGFPDVPVPHWPGSTGRALVDELNGGAITLLNERKPFDWRLGPRDNDRLWTVTLHYHGWLYQLACMAGDDGEAERLLVDHLSDWIERCDVIRPGSTQLAWNAYAIATRAAWWALTYHRLGEAWWAEHDELRRRFLCSFYRQGWYLARKLEYDLRANHLLRDAVGLAWLGRFFEPTDETSRWLRTANALAAEQIKEQVLPDGAHFERSVMYHVHVMEDVMTVGLLLEGATARLAKQTWAKMAEHLAWMRHPDGGVALFNDAGVGGCASPNEMLALAGRLEVEADAEPRRGGRHFEDAGMTAWHGDDWSVFCDVGAIGPSYQPGHAHAGALSFECSHRGRRLVVDPGTFGYDHDDRRRYDRATASHNTVCIDGEDSSEVWHIFRVGRRAKVSTHDVTVSNDGFVVDAEHDGYARLPGKPIHRRRISCEAREALVVEDRVNGSASHDLSGGLLVAPPWRAQSQPGGWRLDNGESQVEVSVEGPTGIELHEEGRPYHPDYGVEQQATRLGWALHDAALPCTIKTVLTSKA